MSLTILGKTLMGQAKGRPPEVVLVERTVLRVKVKVRGKGKVKKVMKKVMDTEEGTKMKEIKR